ncbi:unnamed protein product, partial [Meganyctiphanes norvegica]
MSTPIRYPTPLPSPPRRRRCHRLARTLLATASTCVLLGHPVVIASNQAPQPLQSQYFPAPVLVSPWEPWRHRPMRVYYLVNPPRYTRGAAAGPVAPVTPTSADPGPEPPPDNNPPINMTDPETTIDT